MQIPANYYKDKKVLVMDDNSEARFTLRSMLEDFGAKQIEVVTNGTSCLNTMRSKEFDIMLCDYNLGAGMDGQQVLEEARHYKLLKRSSCYVMVTAETTMEMVMGALEYQPDGYLIKPYNKIDLRTRLDKILKTKAEFHKIDAAIDENKTEQAITYCEEKIKEKPAFIVRCLRIKAELLMSDNEYQQAQEIYKKINEIRGMAWASLGIGETQYLLNNYEEAEITFNSLIRDDKLSIEAYDWLAKTQLALGQSVKAQNTLESAIAKAPKSIMRQMELSRIAMENHDWDTAEKSLKKSVGLGRNSCHKTPENYFNLSDTLSNKISSASDSKKGLIASEALKVLDDAKNEFNDEEISIQCKLMESNVYRSMKKTEKAAQCVEEAKNKYQQLGEQSSTALTTQLAKALLKQGDHSEAEKLIQRIKENLYDEEIPKDLAEQIANIEDQVANESLNNKAVELFQKGEVVEANMIFQEAAKSENASNSVLLNALQTTIEIIKKELKPTSEMAPLAESYISRCASIKESDHSFARYQKLANIFKNLKV